MSRTQNKLNVSQVKSLRQEGRYNDGAGLYLRVRKNGYKSWIFSRKIQGKKREITLGDLEVLSLADAREEARKVRIRIKSGLPWIEEDMHETTIPTFLDVAKLVLETKDATWKNDKTRAQWHMTLKVYAKPLHDKNITDIKTPDVLKILQPIWLVKNETASRLRGRIEAVMDYAKAMGWRSGENPAAWRGNLSLLLPAYSKTKNVKHHAALDMDDMTQFMSDLRSREATVARLLEFIILTAARSGEARFATWSEINFEKKLWTLSAERMKMNKAHVVPLSDSVIRLLNTLAEFRQNELIFLHPTTRIAFSVNATRALLQRMRSVRLTTHGFRSTFRDWAGDRTLHQRETIESALAHSIKDRAEAAYRRTTAIEKRRILMQDWDDFCSGQDYRPDTLLPHLKSKFSHRDLAEAS